MVVSEEELFATRGYVTLRGFHSKARLAELRAQVCNEFARVSVNAGAWRSPRQLPPFQQVTKLSTLVKVRDLHQTLATPELVNLVAKLARECAPKSQETQLLLSPPNQGEWRLDGLNWHVDLRGSPEDQLAGVQAFFLLDDVAPQAGGTLALAGSHLHLSASEAAGASLRQLLRTSIDPRAELRSLGIDLVEMSGRAGDVFLMDMRVLHTPSVNSSKRFRMMATCRFHLKPQASRSLRPLEILVGR